MDPNETLRELRKWAVAIQKKQDEVDAILERDEEPDEYDLTEEAENMAELFQALDEWISSGGFFPKVWLVHQHGRGRERKQ